MVFAPSPAAFIKDGVSDESADCGEVFVVDIVEAE